MEVLQNYTTSDYNYSIALLKSWKSQRRKTKSSDHAAKFHKDSVLECYAEVVALNDKEAELNVTTNYVERSASEVLPDSTLASRGLESETSCKIFLNFTPKLIRIYDHFEKFVIVRLDKRYYYVSLISSEIEYIDTLLTIDMTLFEDGVLRRLDTTGVLETYVTHDTFGNFSFSGGHPLDIKYKSVSEYCYVSHCADNQKLIFYCVTPEFTTEYTTTCDVKLSYKNFTLIDYNLKKREFDVIVNKNVIKLGL